MVALFVLRADRQPFHSHRIKGLNGRPRTGALNHINFGNQDIFATYKGVKNAELFNCFNGLTRMAYSVHVRDKMQLKK